MLNGKNILLVIGGGIAAYKSLQLIRLIRKSGGSVRCILTHGGAKFVTPLSAAALSEQPVYDDLWSLKDETEMGHIRLARECDAIIVAPASANMIAKIAHGLADDLAATTILASNRPLIVCPAMNPVMWANPATQTNVTTLRERAVAVFGPAEGEMACGETGQGRLLEPERILDLLTELLTAHKPLTGKRVLVTAGPTHEPIDPVRFVANRSSGKQGYAIAEALHAKGAHVILISGPTTLAAPQGIETIRIETAAQMLETCQNILPVDIAVCTAAVSDWRPERYAQSKLKKNSDTPVSLSLIENADILSTLSQSVENRPKLVIGFAAETENTIENARAKLIKKRCDWIVANEISTDNPAFGVDQNQVTLIQAHSTEEWPVMHKTLIARELADRIAAYFEAS